MKTSSATEIRFDGTATENFEVHEAFSLSMPGGR